MNILTLLRWGRVPAAVVPLLFIATAAARAPTALTAPPPDAQGYAFSVARGSPALLLGIHPADVLGAGGIVLLSCDDLGLICTSGSGQTDDLAAMSDGHDFERPDLPAVEFSVGAGAAGLAGSAVAAEAGCSPAQPQADVFQSDYAGSNAQDLDGDGTPCAANAGFSLSIAETPASNEVDALSADPCATVDVDCNGLLDDALYFTLAANSPSLAQASATTADILSADGFFAPEVWASRTALGLAATDVIDGLCLSENGNASYDSGDTLYFSLAAGSPTLATLGAQPGDLLQPPSGTAPLRRVASASALGLAPADNVDALLCNSGIPLSGIYLPVIER